MRSAPPLQFCVNRHGLWRAIVLLLAGVTMAAMLAWWWAQPVPVPPWTSVLAVAGVLVSMACAAGLWPTPAIALRWDGQRGRVAREGFAERAGELAVAIDLGGWLWLRFAAHSTPADRATRCRPMWIALQRRGFEAQWHALRCALYSARSAVESDDSAGDIPDLSA